MPKGMIFGFAAGTAVYAAISGTAYGLMNEGGVKRICALRAVWLSYPVRKKVKEE